MTEERQEQNAFIYQGQQNEVPSIVKLRLDVSALQEAIEFFLKGQLIIRKIGSDERIYEEIKSIGEPKANEAGIQNILLRIHAVINPSTVQSNYDEEMLNVYLRHIEESIGGMIMINCYKWDIKDEQQDIIVDFIMDLIEPFMRRTLGNQERILLGSVTKIVERSGQEGEQKKDWFKLVN